RGQLGRVAAQDGDRAGDEALAVAREDALEVGDRAAAPVFAAGDLEDVADAEVGDGEVEVADAEEEAAEVGGALAAGLVGKQGGDGLGEVLDGVEGGGAAVLDAGGVFAHRDGAGDGALL